MGKNIFIYCIIFRKNIIAKKYIAHKYKYIYLLHYIYLFIFIYLFFKNIYFNIFFQRKYIVCVKYIAIMLNMILNILRYLFIYVLLEREKYIYFYCVKPTEAKYI